MKKNTGVKMTIEGHCDQRGSNEYNLSLGERRANSVKQMMQSMYVSAARLSTVSFGEEKPLMQGGFRRSYGEKSPCEFCSCELI